MNKTAIEYGQCGIYFGRKNSCWMDRFYENNIINVNSVINIKVRFYDKSFKETMDRISFKRSLPSGFGSAKESKTCHS